MAISNVSTDYSNRKRDIHILQGVKATQMGKAKITPSFGKISNYCAGVQKLVQRYTISFFTIAGSQDHFAEFGTSFLQKISSARRNMTKEEIGHLFNFANAKIITEFKQYQADNPDQPLDEQIAKATLLNASALGDTLNLDIKIITLAGDVVEFLLPLPETL